MEENPAYGATQTMAGEQLGDYATVTGEETREYAYANPSQLHEIKDKRAQTQKCALIAITVILVITLMIALVAFAMGIVTLYSLGQESISSVNQLTAHTQWAQESFAELLGRDSSLQSTVNNLTSQINNPAIRRLNQSCIVDTISCNIGPETSDFYWRGCLTLPELPKTTAVSYFICRLYDFSEHSPYVLCIRTHQGVLICVLRMANVVL